MAVGLGSTIGAWLTVIVAATVLTGALLGDALTTEDASKSWISGVIP